jgi:hypothetical protein
MYPQPLWLHGIVVSLRKKPENSQLLSVILTLNESENSAANIWYQSRTILLTSLHSLTADPASSSNTGCPCSPFSLHTDKQQLV